VDGAGAAVAGAVAAVAADAEAFVAVAPKFGGSTPTMFVTTGAPSAVVVADVEPASAFGSTPTALETTGADAAVSADAAGAGVFADGRIDSDCPDADDCAGGVRLRLSFTTGTRTVRVVRCRFAGVTVFATFDCVCVLETVCGFLNTSGGAAAFVFGAFVGAADGTRITGKRSGMMLSAWREWTREGGAINAARTIGRTYTPTRLSEPIATAIRAIFAVRRPIRPYGYGAATVLPPTAGMTCSPSSVPRRRRSVGAK
jgi:hypothetical protein